jgi:hypothetical protein
MGKSPKDKLKDIPEAERWLFDPKNKAIVQELKRALKQKANNKIDLAEFGADLADLEEE